MLYSENSKNEAGWPVNKARLVALNNRLHFEGYIPRSSWGLDIIALARVLLMSDAFHSSLLRAGASGYQLG